VRLRPRTRPATVYEHLFHRQSSFEVCVTTPSDERNAHRTPNARASTPPGVLATIAPDIAFRHAANAAAAAIERAPAFVTYHVVTHVSAPALGKSRDVVRAVAVRTSDDLAVLQDLPRGANALGHGFPITPSFDALSYFTLSWKVGTRTDVSSYVHDITPLRYAEGAPSQADVVVFRLRQYRAEYANDSSDAADGRTHVALVPYDFVKKAAVRPDSTFYLSDVVIDNATHLPASVRYQGGDDIDFTVDYAMQQGHWVVSHAHYEETLHGPLRIGRLRVIADAVYDSFTFPETAPDPRLVPTTGTPAPATPAPRTTSAAT